jgi:hypothetical protein
MMKAKWEKFFPSKFNKVTQVATVGATAVGVGTGAYVCRQTGKK